MRYQIFISAAALSLMVLVSPASADWSCNSSGPGGCVPSNPDELQIICDPGGMSSEPGGGQTCTSGAAATRPKAKRQHAKPGLRRQLQSAKQGRRWRRR